MKSYGISDGGYLIVEHVASLPSWTSDDKGRLIWETSSEKFYFGGGTEWEELGTSSEIELGSDDDGDMYYRDSDVLTRLPKGTSNQKLFMNSLGTIPDWSNSDNVQYKTYTIRETGSKSITGVGFKPSLILCITEVSDNDQFSFGACDSNLLNTCIYSYDRDLLNATDSYIAYNRDGGDIQTFEITSLDSDGFTMTIAHNNPGSTSDYIHMFFACFR